MLNRDLNSRFEDWLLNRRETLDFEVKQGDRGPPPQHRRGTRRVSRCRPALPSRPLLPCSDATDSCSATGRRSRSHYRAALQCQPDLPQRCLTAYNAAPLTTRESPANGAADLWKTRNSKAACATGTGRNGPPARPRRRRACHPGWRRRRSRACSSRPRACAAPPTRSSRPSSRTSAPILPPRRGHRRDRPHRGPISPDSRSGDPARYASCPAATLKDGSCRRPDAPVPRLPHGGCRTVPRAAPGAVRRGSARRRFHSGRSHRPACAPAPR